LVVSFRALGYHRGVQHQRHHSMLSGFPGKLGDGKKKAKQNAWHFGG